MTSSLGWPNQYHSSINDRTEKNERFVKLSVNETKSNRRHSFGIYCGVDEHFSFERIENQ